MGRDLQQESTENRLVELNGFPIYINSTWTQEHSHSGWFSKGKVCW